jgi:hypothetical protein
VKINIDIKKCPFVAVMLCTHHYGVREMNGRRSHDNVFKWCNMATGGLLFQLLAS